MVCKLYLNKTVKNSSLNKTEYLLCYMSGTRFILSNPLGRWYYSVLQMRKLGYRKETDLPKISYIGLGQKLFFFHVKKKSLEVGSLGKVAAWVLGTLYPWNLFLHCAWFIFPRSPHGSKLLLGLQPMHPHFRQQKGGRCKRCSFPSLREQESCTHCFRLHLGQDCISCPHTESLGNEAC